MREGADTNRCTSRLTGLRNERGLSSHLAGRILQHGRFAHSFGLGLARSVRAGKERNREGGRRGTFCILRRIELSRLKTLHWRLVFAGRRSDEKEYKWFYLSVCILFLLLH
jgi:hypothetical protein